MKNILGLLILSIFFLPSCNWPSEEAVGHVGFFFISPVKTDEDFEAQDDFKYYYQQLVPWLKKNRFAYSYHTTTPITLNLKAGKSIVIRKDQLKDDLGMIYSKMDGTYKISYGVGTDIDTIMEIKEFFELE